MCSVASASGRRASRWHAVEVTVALPLRDCGLRHIDCTFMALIREFIKPEATMRIFPWRLVLLMAMAVSVVGYPQPATATTVNVTVAPGGAFVFSPSSVTISPGDTVRWTWDDDFHSSTSGRPGMPNGLWSSGVLIQGAVFTHTFNSVGTFQYYCTPHWRCCNMVGTDMVA